MNVLYIHGLGGSKEGDSGRVIKRFLEEKGHRVYLETFDLTRVEETLARLDELLVTWKIDRIVATSLGAFYALLMPDRYGKILTNPCMFPSKEIPRLQELEALGVQKFQELEEELYSRGENKETRNLFAAFASHDELFAYKDFFVSQYPEGKTYDFEGGHQLNEDAWRRVLERAALSLNLNASC